MVWIIDYKYYCIDLLSLIIGKKAKISTLKKARFMGNKDLLQFFFKNKTTLYYIFIISVFSSDTIASISITVPSEEYQTILQALMKTKSGDTIWVKEGIYKEQVKLHSGIVLISQELFKATIDGSGNKNGITMGNYSTISGFRIKNAHIGVYSEGTDNVIKNCFIHDNRQSSIMVVGHLPSIIDNIIVENGGSGVQGWNVRSTISTINHNTIAYNTNHGIAIGGKSDIVVENNIIAFNEKLGLKAEKGVKIKLIRNNFFLNTEIVQSLPSENFSFDPMFIAATLMNFMISPDSRCRNMASDAQNIGARIVY